jgi:hypothetical protein
VPIYLINGREVIHVFDKNAGLNNVGIIHISG